MTKEKIEEMLADLGYVILHIKNAQANASVGQDYGSLNRARELAHKVGDVLKSELSKRDRSKDKIAPET